MTRREWFRLSRISLFLLLSTLPIQPADKVLFGAKAIWDVTLSLLGVGALRHATSSAPTAELEAVVTQPVGFPVSPKPADITPVYKQESAPSSQSTVSVRTDAGSIGNLAKDLNDIIFDTKNDPINKWDEFRQQQEQRQLNLSSRKGVAGSPEFFDRIDHPEKYDVNGRLITDRVYGFPSPNTQPINPNPNAVAPYVPTQLNPNTKEVQQLHKQATTVTATALVMMTQLAPVATSQAPLIASISTEATKTHAVGDMLDMMRNPAPEVDPAMITFLKDGTMPATVTPTSISAPMAAGGALVAGGTAIAGKGLAAGAFATAAKGIAITAAAIGVAPGTLLVGGVIVAAGTAGYVYSSHVNAPKPLQNQKTVQNENNGNKKEDDGGPKKPKKDYSDTIGDLAEKAKKAKELADEVSEEARKRGWTENNSMPKEDDAITMGHIFNKNDGHDLYSKESYDELNRLVKDAKNFVGRDEHGKEWFSEILKDGRERWAYSKGGTVKSGGTSSGTTPSVFCPKKGLVKVKPTKPVIIINNKANL